MEESKIPSLETKMEHMEHNIESVSNLLGELNKKIDRIEVGLFGDQRFGFVGIIETQKGFDERIGELEKEIEAIKKVNDQQEAEIKVKRNFTDDIVLWLQRAFWAGVVFLLAVFLLTGKIGIGDFIGTLR